MHKRLTHDSGDFSGGDFAPYIVENLSFVFFALACLSKFGVDVWKRHKNERFVQKGESRLRSIEI